MINIRTPDLRDTAALAALGRKTFVDTFGDLYAAGDLQSFLGQTYSEKAIAAELKNADLLWQVAEMDGELVGYCKLFKGMELDYPNAEASAYQLKQLYILDQYQGKGAAHQLMQWALQQARNAGASQMALSVYCDNIRAQRFYLGYGFSHVADAEFHVGSHVDHEFIFLTPLIT